MGALATVIAQTSASIAARTGSAAAINRDNVGRHAATKSSQQAIRVSRASERRSAVIPELSITQKMMATHIEFY
jgi:hypothetical protein